MTVMKDKRTEKEKAEGCEKTDPAGFLIHTFLMNILKLAERKKHVTDAG